ncbi:unnamed protein product [Kuraishia capsulata CBS 1993]|uniref:G domain-containing protein n=1 Tax=Kuraishia capsulata CBS 1993 TaxID=1382522 RepID=W6MR37_9ASCO|nr:uncharacterized protein KUCA_T00004803001 [Kuraishia capsulata CBS 1993]CDK28818.1 unnamed protein product [Kuraishia capsulata CBS 1993]
MVSGEFIVKTIADPPPLGKSKRRNPKYKQSNVLFVGPQKAGKTTLLSVILHKEVRHVIPTIGFNTEALCYDKYNYITVYDVQGTTPSIRNCGSLHDTVDLRCVVFFVDAMSKKELYDVNPQSAYYCSEKIVWGFQLSNVDPAEGAADDAFVSLPILFVLTKCDLKAKLVSDIAVNEDVDSERTLVSEAPEISLEGSMDEDVIRKLQDHEISSRLADGSLSGVKDLVTMADIIDRYKLLELGIRRKWAIVESSAFTGQGIDNILKWIADVC